jgi:hypothetical protein
MMKRVLRRFGYEKLHKAVLAIVREDAVCQRGPPPNHSIASPTAHSSATGEGVSSARAP